MKKAKRTPKESLAKGPVHLLEAEAGAIGVKEHPASQLPGGGLRDTGEGVLGTAHVAPPGIPDELLQGGRVGVADVG